jgi:hypothetical protein
MKIRSGFVSNSSSSSFIIGYGVVKDVDHFKSYLKKNKIKINSDGVWGGIDIFDSSYDLKSDDCLA